MKLLASFLLSALVLSQARAAEPVRAVAGYVFDGDTFAAQVKLENDVSISVRVRILGIDAPEIHGDCESEILVAFKARDRLEKLLPAGSVVYLSKIKDDKYLGRIDANVKTADGRDVGAIMIKEKLARKYGGKKRQPWCK
jgi:endonuclease YncB( thermonuclease family)